MHGSSVKTFKQKKIFWQIDNYGDNHKECEDGSHINVGGDDDDDGGGGDDDGGGVDDQCEVAIWQEQVGEDLLVCTKVNLLQREKYVIASQSKSSNDFEICFPEHLNCQI